MLQGTRGEAAVARSKPLAHDVQQPPELPAAELPSGRALSDEPSGPIVDNEPPSAQTITDEPPSLEAIAAARQPASLGLPPDTHHFTLSWGKLQHPEHCCRHGGSDVIGAVQ